MKPEPTTEEFIIQACDEHKTALLAMAKLSEDEEIL